MIDNAHIRLFKTQRLLLPAGTWNTQDVRSTFWRFYWNQDDGAWLDLNDGPYPLHAETPYFIPAGVFFHCRNEAPVEHFYVHFDLLGLPRFALDELFPGPICLPKTVPIQATVRELADTLLSSPEPDLLCQCRIKSALYLGLVEHLDTIGPERLARCGQRTAALAPVQPALDYIEDHLHEKLCNLQFAGLCCLSTEHFIRRFHTLVGQLPAQYVMERRVTIAAQRLLFTEGSIEQIAEATGFSNRFYFSRVFTRLIGLPPAAFRQSKRV